MSYPSAHARWEVLPFNEWILTNAVKELVHSSRVAPTPVKPIPSPK